MVKTNTDLFSLVGKIMVNSIEWKQLGIFVFLFVCFFFYYLNAPVSTPSLWVGKYNRFSASKSRQGSFHSGWWRILQSQHFFCFFFFFKMLFIPTVLCLPQCVMTELQFYLELYHMCKLCWILLCRNPIIVPVSMHKFPSVMIPTCYGSIN